MKEIVANILGSATKIVFIVVALALVVFTWIGKIDSKDFMVLATMVFSAYYRLNRTDASTERRPVELDKKPE